MKRLLADLLLEQAKENKDIFVLTGDLGMGMWDKFKEELPDQFLNCGASEQAMLDIAVGMAYEGKIPFVYSITPFLLYRAFETIRTYINHEKLNIKLLGGGRDEDYKNEGYSHNANDALEILNTQRNISRYWPETDEEIPVILKKVLDEDGPSFISLRK